MRVLLAIENSRFAMDAAPFLTRQFHPDETEIRIVHAVQPIAVSIPPQMSPGYFPELEGQFTAARQVIEGAARELHELGFNATYAVVEGLAEDVILEEANNWHADLIIVGSHQRRGLNRLLLGSVSEAVLRKAPCSVEVLRLAA
jgi:nucleotide-binding universal stress UspA family protein